MPMTVRPGSDLHRLGVLRNYVSRHILSAPKAGRCSLWHLAVDEFDFANALKLFNEAE